MTDTKPTSSQTPQRSLPDRVDVLVIGTGFGGLAALHQLDENHRGLEVLAVERGDSAGGVWRANSYPGAACDVPTSLYSLSFAPEPGWSHTYGRQGEIHTYLKRVAERFADRIRYGVDVTGATWLPDEQRWRVTTSAGTVDCRFLIAAPGALSEPGVPEIDGLDEFDGEVFHSAYWRHDVDLVGKKVAVVGTGASAIQIVPEIADSVGTLTVFQRTAGWVLPRLDRRIGAGEQNLYRRLPVVHKLVRMLVWLYREVYVVLMARLPKTAAVAKLLARAQLRLQVRDRRMRKALTPDFVIGCKRILLSNKWYPTLQKPNVTVAPALRRLTAGGAVDSDGVEHAADIVVFATGFTPTEPPLARLITGRDGQTLAQAWSPSPTAYRGIEIHGFPNLFFMYGPNTNLGHSSIVLMLEAQAGYISRAIETVQRSQAATIEVTEAAQRDYSLGVDEQLSTTVWNSGCESWYLDETGRNSVMWPTFTRTYQKMMRTYLPADHVLQPAVATTGGDKITAQKSATGS